MKKLMMLLFACAAFVAVADVGGVEPITDEPTEYNATTCWGNIPADACVKEVVEGCGVKSAPDDYEQVRATVANWETYWGGSNVVFEVTNYYGNTSGEIPRLRIKELIEGEGYKTVWDDNQKFAVFTETIRGEMATATAECKTECAANSAPRAWGTVTDKGLENPADNTVWMTSPSTVFAGGTEFQRVAVGTGAICVLTRNGAAAYTTGQDGTFRFQDDMGEAYFGFSKTDSYTIGCNTDGIEVSGGMVTLRYDVIMGDGESPIAYYSPTIPFNWVQLNNPDQTPADGAPVEVTWGMEGATHLAFINVGLDAPTGFFKAETSVAGEVIFETNMKMRLDGGVLCTDGRTVLYPHADGTWRTTK